MVDRTKEYIEFTKICGDCNRRFRMKFEIPEVKINRADNPIIDKELKLMIRFMFPKYEMCCKKCSDKKNKEDSLNDMQ
jgi:hypothetical protein